MFSWSPIRHLRSGIQLVKWKEGGNDGSLTFIPISTKFARFGPRIRLPLSRPDDNDGSLTFIPKQSRLPHPRAHSARARHACRIHTAAAQGLQSPSSLCSCRSDPIEAGSCIGGDA
jgi:hypothetical protein